MIPKPLRPAVAAVLCTGAMILAGALYWAHGVQAQPEPVNVYRWPGSDQPVVFNDCDFTPLRKLGDDSWSLEHSRWDARCAGVPEMILNPKEVR